MAEIRQITGDLYVKEHPSTNVSEEFMRSVKFISNSICFETSNIMVSDRHFCEQDTTMLYYPEYNESQLQFMYPIGSFDISSEYECHKEITIECIVTKESVFIRSVPDIVAYSPFHLYINENVYTVNTVLLQNTTQTFEADELLQMKSVDNGVLITNNESNVTMPVEKEVVWDLLDDTTDPIGAIKLRDSAHSLSQTLLD